MQAFVNSFAHDVPL